MHNILIFKIITGCHISWVPFLTNIWKVCLLKINRHYTCAQCSKLYACAFIHQPLKDTENTQVCYCKPSDLEITQAEPMTASTQDSSTLTRVWHKLTLLMTRQKNLLHSPPPQVITGPGCCSWHLSVLPPTHQNTSVVQPNTWNNKLSCPTLTCI